MMTKRRWITGLVVGGLLIGCGSSSTGNDAGHTGTDAGTDTGTLVTDTGPADSGQLPDAATGDVVTAQDVADASTTPSLCSSPTAITATPGPDGTVHVMGNNNSAPTVAIGDISNCTMGSQVGTVVYSYTMRTTAYLVASTDYADTDQNLSTILEILQTCSTDAEPLACDDYSYWDPSYLSTVATTQAIPMGTTVFIVVSGYDMPNTPDMQGAYDLGVKEVQPTPVGTTCGQFTACIASSDCLLTNTLPATNACIAEGAQGGLCVGADMTCNTGLTCSNTSETCVATAADGAACDPAGDYYVCSSTSTCVPVPTATSHTTYHCVPNGTPGSSCSSTTPACTGTSSCEPGNGSLCQMSVSPGGTCDLLGQSTTCVSGSSDAGTATYVCAPSSATAATCIASIPVPSGTHNTPTTAVAPVTTTTVYSGALTSATDVDCFGVTVAMGHSLYLETEQPGGPVCDPTMLSDTLITLYNPAGMNIASDNFETPASDCSRIDPLTTTAAANLTAGTYTVCVGTTLGPMTSGGNIPYTVTIGVE